MRESFVEVNPGFKSGVLKRNIVCFFMGTSFLSRESFEALASACFRFSPLVALRYPDSIFINIRGCDGLFSEKGLALRLLALGRRFCEPNSFQGRVTFAEDVPTALALARFPLSSVKRGLPLEALSDYDAPFGKKSGKVSPRFMDQTLLVLKKLGLKNLGDFMDLPPQSLAARFGQQGVEMRARIDGAYELPWPNFQPQEEIAESVELDEEVHLESVFFVLRGVVDRTMARLRGLAKRASKLAIELEVKKLSTVAHEDLKRRWEIELPIPQGAAPALMGILRDRIDFDLTRQPLVGGVERVCFQILETVPGQGAQLDFFDKKEEEQEKWNGLVGRLVHQLGKESVFVAHPVDRYLPEKAWRRALQEMPKTLETEFRDTEQGRERPLRVLKTPEPLQFQNGFLLHRDGKRWKLLRAEGPERMTPEWWSVDKPSEISDPKDFKLTRDYYQMTVEKGQQLWVFLSYSESSREEGSLFLHGYFD